MDFYVKFLKVFFLIYFIVLISFLICSLVLVGTTTENVLAYSVESVHSTSDSFFLGSGNMDEDPVYYVYTQNDDKSFSLVTLKAKEIKLFIDLSVGEDAYIVFEDRQYLLRNERVPIELHVPVNSLIKQYDFSFGDKA